MNYRNSITDKNLKLNNIISLEMWGYIANFSWSTVPLIVSSKLKTQLILIKKLKQSL